MRKLLGMLTLIGSLLVTAPAWAKEGEENLLVPYGMSAYAGGGVGDFTDEQMRDATGTAALWEARLHFGTRLPIGLEVGYIGGLRTIDSLGLDTDARLLSTTVEGTLRFDFIRGPLSPYVFGGAGWTRFDLTNFDANTSSVEDQDDVLVIPVGIGVAYRYDRVIADLRGTVRATAYDDLVPATNSSDHEPLTSWGAALHVGFEF